MTMKEFLFNKYNGKMPVSEDDPEGSPHSKSAEVQEYLAIEQDDPDLSSVDFDDKVVICGKKFQSFTAVLCDFHKGLSITECKISGDVSFEQAYTHQNLELVNVKVGGDFVYPDNIVYLVTDELDGAIHIVNLSVAGVTTFTKP